METIDAQGRSCPEPVLLTQKAVNAGQTNVTVLVDSRTALENVSRFAEGKGFAVQVNEQDDEYTITLEKA